MAVKKIAVLGAGLSGLTIARKLQEKGYEVAIYEKDNTLGGLIKSRVVNGHVYDLYGGHLLEAKHTEIVDWVFSLMPKEQWQYCKNNAKILFGDKRLSYPLEQTIYNLDTDVAVECIYDLIMAQQGPKPDNYRDWIIWNFGKGIADLYMLPYNSKIWAYPLEDMETQWMEGKMPLPSKKDVLRTLIRKEDASVRKMPMKTFYYPTFGGIQSMANAIAKGLEIRLNQPVTSLKKEDGRWIVNHDDDFDVVISTLPLPEMPKIMELPSSVQAAMKDLKFNSLTTVLCKCPPTDITWLYIPEKQYRMHRIGYQSALTPAAAPDGSGLGALEIIGPQFEVTKDLIFQPNIVPSTLGLSEALDWAFAKYAYMIYDKHYRANTGKIFEYFSTVSDFHLLGRWATWSYKNMNVCIKDAFNLAEKFE